MTTILVPVLPEIQPKTQQRPPKVSRKVRRGAAYLDRVRPGWQWRVNPSTINLVSPTDCVLGQTFGYYLNFPDKCHGPFWGMRRGFMGGKRMQQQWRDYVIYRRMLDS
jgi:hypothetical protein